MVAIPIVGIAIAELVEALVVAVSAAMTGKAVSDQITRASEKADEKLKDEVTSDACTSCKPPDDKKNQNKKPEEDRKNDPIKDSEKLERQMEKRGWTKQQVEEAIQKGEKFPAKNNKTGGSATRYVHPQTGQSVVIDNSTGGIIHVGGPGFIY
jgi:membrane carboxypeptidase/penicillin-binding protein